MKGETEKDFKFGTWGILLGIIVLIGSIVWVTLTTLDRDDKSGESAMWVG